MKTRGRQRGFILIETVFAIAIVATIVATAAGAMSVSARVMDQADVRSTAAWIAVSQSESIQAATYVSTGGTYSSVAAPSGYSVSNATLAFPGGDDFIQYVDITVMHGSDTVSVTRIVKIQE